MKRQYCKILLAALALSTAVGLASATPVVTLGDQTSETVKGPSKAAQRLEINGTGASESFEVNASNLPDDITITATPGLEVFPTKLPANATGAKVYVTMRSTLPVQKGKVILRSGDFRGYVYVEANPTPLQTKDLSKNPVFTGTEKRVSYREADGFKPGENGYTVEFRVKLGSDRNAFDVYGVTPEGASFKAYVDPEAMGLYNGSSKIGFENPLTTADGGKKQFYNTDGKFHTYRYSVTSDKRVFVYRDGIQVATLRAKDYGTQPEWAVANGEVSENLLKNGNFEGEWNMRATDSLVNKVEGWIVDPIDRYNCTYEVPNLEVNNELDFNNHVLKLQRYNWNDGWGSGTVSQIVDVAPNSTYSLSFLAGGGMDLKSGAIMSSVKLQEVQDSRLGSSVDITNEEGLVNYGLNYTTSADCKQLKVVVYNERFLNGGGWGSNPQPFYVDEMALVGQSRTLDQLVGFESHGNLEYFTYDATGAYAPVTPVLEPAQKTLVIDGTGSSKTVKVRIADLLSADKVSVTATKGFSVSPETLAADKDGEITVTLNSTLDNVDGKIILRAGDLRKYISLTGHGSALERKDIKTNTVCSGDDSNAFTHRAADGFTPGKDGYTVEFRVKVKSDRNEFNAFAVTPEGSAFKTYVNSGEIGFYNSGSKISIPNPATSATGGKSQFYNTDGKFHTYRYAVTSDGRVVAYRDGIEIARVRAKDYGMQPEWAVANGEVSANLLKNGNFEGEWNVRATDSLVNKIEGWVVDPIDRYNCTYEVPNLEVNNELDFNNHVLKLQRYNWNDGWGSGTVSQIVDVAPNSTYSLSFLAGGGMDLKSGAIMSSVKLQEVQNSQLGTSVDITNEEGLVNYGLNYTTSADCKQLKVVVYNERFLNGGGWGSNPQPFYVDEMALAGQSRTLDQLVGFNRGGVNVEYFAYDPTGAYAPLAPGFGDDISGINDIDVNEKAFAVANAEGLAVYNVEDGTTVTVYDTMGAIVAKVRDYAPGSTVALPRRGVYICVVRGSNGDRNFKLVF